MGNEPFDLAQTFVKMLAAVPVQSGLVKKPRNLAIDQLKTADPNLSPAVVSILELCRDEQADWKTIGSALEKQFEQDPSLAEKLWATQDWPRPFWLVLREELKQVIERRGQDQAAVDQAGDLYKFVSEKELVGLAFSGGGIRSATFNLGVLQALAEFGFLPHLDILSTVSGGGYIGAWFASWMQRCKLHPAELQKLLSPKNSPNPDDPAQKPVRFLRQFSNYLTPALGIFSFDTWTMAAIYLRNVLLNQITLIAGFGALLILPRLAGAVSDWQAHRGNAEDWIYMIAAAFLLLVSVFFIAMNLRSAIVAGQGAPKSSLPAHIQFFCIWPLLAAVFISSQLFWKHANESFFQSLTEPWFFWPACLFFGLLSLIISLFGGFVRCFLHRLTGNSVGQLGLVLAMVTVVASLAGTLLLRGYIILMQFFSAHTHSGVWHGTVWGPPALLAVFALAAIVQVGLMGIDFPDAGREWLSRFRAMTNLYTFFWLALFCAAIYGPWLIARFDMWAAGLGTAWIGTTVTSVLAGKSARSGQAKEGEPTTSKVDLVAKLGPPVFLVGFVMVVSYGVHLLLAHEVFHGNYSFANQTENHWAVFNRPLEVAGALWNGGDWTIAAPATLLFTLTVVALLFAWRVDINEFSMHHFYKNRLVRCYLGASNLKRKPNAFIGFDDNDELAMTDLKASPSGYKGPYHIVNATLNLSAGGQLAWQERQAASFIFTPCYSGFNLETDSDHPGDEKGGGNLRFCAYRKTEQYAYNKGIGLGTAISISGAAADPNQGYNTSPAVAFLMTVFDVRLGWWLGNPRKDTESKLSSPRLGIAALVSSLFGQSDDRSNFVSLSDGGHFDNMGIYELVRRRCKYIVLCDAEQDKGYTFGGLGMAIRKCRVDFGAEIDIDPSRIVPAAAAHRSGVHCAVGTIRYADGKQGVLVYIKSSLTGDEPEDVLQYAAGKAEFPHETTADQWFSESQFESYRKLGYHAASCTLGPVNKWLQWDPASASVAPLFDALQKHWYPLNPALVDHASAHTKTLNDLFDKIRVSNGLQALGSKLFPGGNFTAQTTDPAAEYFFCMTLIQLVEDIYVDFGLDRTVWHDDPRIGGWMTIFRTWKVVAQVDSTWQAGKDTFRVDFQRFWNNL